MKKSNSITVIIPVHELNEVTKPMLTRALESVNQQTVKVDSIMVVGPDSVIADFNEAKEGLEFSSEVVFLTNDGETDFSSQLNYAVDNVKTSHFMLLEFDDTLTEIWTKNVQEYMSAYPEVSMFLPLVVNHNEEGQVLGTTNEPVWANEFSDKLGELDTETLLRYNDFTFDGMVMSVEKYKEFGGLKTSMKLVFPLEFMLRVTELSGRIMVVPKVGYKHLIQREGSLFMDTKSNLSIDEQRWWLALAKKEYFHIKDRKITYEKED